MLTRKFTRRVMPGHRSFDEMVRSLQTRPQPRSFALEFNNDGRQPLKVPGFGLSIDHDPFADRNGLGFWDKDNFRHGCSNHFSFLRLTVRELTMLKFIDAITDKPEWHAKIFQPEIISRWKEEAVVQSKSMIDDDIYTWLVAELQDKARTFQETGLIAALDTESRVIKSDTHIDNELRDALRSSVEKLLTNPDRDWHPNSNNQVLNLVHPSLFPLVYGRTQALKEGQTSADKLFDRTQRTEIVPGDQKVDPTRKGGGYIVNIDNKGLWSTRFQWLPCDVAFTSEHDTSVQITSYINNLHPHQHESLYGIVERLISKSIPLWNRILFRGFSGRTPLRIKTSHADFDPPCPRGEWPYLWGEKGTEETKALITRVQEYLDQPEPPHSADLDSQDPPAHPPTDWQNYIFNDSRDDNDTYWSPDSLVDNKWQRIRKVKHPKPEQTFAQWKSANDDNESVTLQDEFRERGLQVIVKLASIELTPDKPKYDGGNWHLEGMQNEHIVATSIYYFDVENTTTARIRFRQNADLDNMSMTYEQDDHAPLAEIFGVESRSLRDEPAVQEIGSVATPGGRILAFPNTLQHRVEPFELQDRARPGHRRFLVLWLVDPHFRILSTANVPPQQQDWWDEAKTQAGGDSGTAAQAQTLMSGREAREFRLELMKERTTFADTLQNNLDSYNFCEH